MLPMNSVRQLKAGKAKVMPAKTQNKITFAQLIVGMWQSDAKC